MRQGKREWIHNVAFWVRLVVWIAGVGLTYWAVLWFIKPIADAHGFGGARISVGMVVSIVAACVVIGFWGRLSEKLRMWLINRIDPLIYPETGGHH